MFDEDTGHGTTLMVQDRAWGKGRTFKEAHINVKKSAGTKKRCFMLIYVFADVGETEYKEIYCDEMGNVHWPGTLAIDPIKVRGTI